MASRVKNIAYIDAANLHKGIRDSGWELDYQRFRVWLADKYDIGIAYLFIGLVPDKKDLYTRLQEIGYVLVYKEVTYDGAGKVKGNCDTDLVLKAVVDYYEKHSEKAVLVTSDGDYAGLVKFLREKDSFLSLISPHVKCSYLLRKLNIPIVYLETQKYKLDTGDKKKKPPAGTEPR